MRINVWLWLLAAILLSSCNMNLDATYWEKCDAKCGIIKYSIIEGKCHCKTETGWREEELK